MIDVSGDVLPRERERRVLHDLLGGGLIDACRESKNSEIAGHTDPTRRIPRLAKKS
jgi:hypothetical protein